MRRDSERDAAITVIPLRNATGWRLVHRTPTGADVLASSPGNGTEHSTGTSTETMRRGLRRLGDGDGTLAMTETVDHHWQWTLADIGDAPIASSPPIYRDPGSCRRAYLDARRAAHAAADQAGR
ncbi:hypothetical protein ACQP1P_27750 [Dactylosporangium sp. CA-052675]|uniref:hypothetical protein n=1 Tax=Dactylosporangium sp. CA-052675 TaxID=3239927 RepID=UPI003D9363B8